VQSKHAAGEDGERRVTSAKAVRWHPRQALVRARSHSPPYVQRLVSNTVQALAGIEPFDRAMTLAAQAFTSFFPLAITLATALEPWTSASLADRVADNLSLPAATRSALDAALGNPSPEEAAAFGGAGLLIVLVSATSFARALARMYARVWQVPPSGWRGGWRWLAVVLAVFTCTFALQAVHGAAGSRLGATIGALLLTLGVNALLWTWVPWVLLVRRAQFTVLLPGGFLMGVGSVGTLLASQIYMPRALTAAAREFGSFGVAFTYIGWLFVVAFVLILTTVLGAVLVQDGAGPKRMSRSLSEV
jgi:membrane protein